MKLSAHRSKYWKTAAPRSMHEAMDLSLEYAREAENLSADRVAERMGLGTKWALYKKVGDEQLKAVEIRAFEHATGIHLVTRYLAASAGMLLVQIPLGRGASDEDLADFHATLTDCFAVVLAAYTGRREIADAVMALTEAMRQSAWHQANLAKRAQPELDLAGGGA